MDILVIGDSFTYSPDLNKENTWPYQLQNLLEVNIYNASCCSWGMMQYYLAINDLIKFAPKQVFLSIYVGADIYEAYRDTLVSESMIPKKIIKKEDPILIPDRIPEWRNRSNIIRNLEEKYSLTRGDALKVCENKNIMDCSVSSWDGLNYYLTPQIRNTLMDIKGEYVNKGLDLTKTYLRLIINKLKSKKIDLNIILFPTKEYVFYINQISHNSYLKELYTNENLLKSELSVFIEEFEVNLLDLSENFFFEKNPKYFFENTDNPHFNASGNKFIASIIKNHFFK
jgi:hypothetical protein